MSPGYSEFVRNQQFLKCGECLTSPIDWWKTLECRSYYGLINDGSEVLIRYDHASKILYQLRKFWYNTPVVEECVGCSETFYNVNTFIWDDLYLISKCYSSFALSQNKSSCV